MKILTPTLNRFAFSAGQSGPATARAALVFGWLLAAGFVAGCKSSSPSQYTAPRVEGRVLDAQTHQPLGGVVVRRSDPGASVGSREVPKGGQSMQQVPAVRTGSDGAFALDSERNLKFFHRSGWYSVALSFKHEDYLSFTTNYTPANATMSPRGEPEVQAGDILLVPLAQSQGR